MPVHVVVRKNCIEDHYDYPCAVALTPEGATAWVARVVASANRVREANTAGNAAVDAWKAENPDPFSEPEPPRPPRWPSGLSTKDPRHPELRAERDRMNAAIQQWRARKDASDAARKVLTDAVFAAAVDPLGLTPREREKSRHHSYGAPTSEDDFRVEEWPTAEEEDGS